MYKVVIVDDNVSSVELIHRLIGQHLPECEVVGVAYDGQKGLALIAAHHPEIVIADIHMSGTDGLQMVEAARQHSPRSKVIFVSAYDEFRYARQALRLEASDYILKPFAPDELVKSVEKAIRSLQTAAVEPVRLQQEGAGSAGVLVQQILDYVSSHISEPISLKVLANHFNFCPSYISALIKKETGRSFIGWLTDAKVEYAKKLLMLPSYRVEEVASLVGYKNYVNFYKVFVKATGMPPREFRRIKGALSYEDQT